MTAQDSTPDLLSRLEQAIRNGHRGEERRLRETIDLTGADAGTTVGVANLYWRAGRTDETREILTRASERFPDDARVWLTLAIFLCRQKDFEGSLPLFERAIELAPEDGTARHRYGWALSTIGRTPEAVSQLHKAVELDPANAAAHYLLSTLKRYRRGDHHLQELRDVLRRELPPRQRSRLLFALGRALEQTGDYDESFERYAEANRLRRAEFQFDVATETAHAEWLIENFNAEMSAGSGGFASDVPVFIVGMPRSGSTLLEHMLSCHPEIAGAGETPLFFQSLETLLGSTLMPGAPTVPLPQASDGVWRDIGRRYVDRLRQSAGFRTRIVDKQLFNYYVLGPIAFALRDATIVYCTRDPRDMALSCYTTAFREGRPWVYDLDELCTAWQAHRRLMAHWQSLLPGRIVELRYEDLIDDPEAQLRSLLATIGVAWSDSCLGFSSSSRPVETASRGQVSRPLHRESVNRWQKFSARLDGIADRLSKD